MATLRQAPEARKTTVMAMIIAWQTVNAVRRPGSRRFSRGFLVVTPGLTIRDRLRVLQPNDPDSYYRGRELVPADTLADLGRARIVITNFHAFRRRETLPLSRGGCALLQGRGASIRSIESDGQILLCGSIRRALCMVAGPEVCPGRRNLLDAP